jgi:hypothetical protein
LLRAAACSCLRRALVFPYLRRWDLALLCLTDVAAMYLRGRRVALRSLLRVRNVLARDEARYLLNALFVDDYCGWLQAIPDALLAALGSQLVALLPTLSKTEPAFAHWEVEALEAAGCGGAATGNEDEAEGSSSSSSEGVTDSAESDDVEGEAGDSSSSDEG